MARVSFPARFAICLTVALALTGGPAAPPAGAAAGDLSLAGCFGSLAGCTPAGPAGVLGFARGVAVSPDGKNLYAAAQEGDALSHFTLDAAGTPAFAACFGAPAGCGAGGPALDGAFSLAISGDGKHLYVSGNDADAVSHFTLDAAGTPAFADCVGNHAGCVATSPATALDTVTGITTTADAKNLYAAALTSSVVNHFTLGGDGTPSFAGCIGVLAGCTSTSPSSALSGAADVTATPDGKHLYAAAVSANDITHFTIRPTGGLDFAGCIGSPVGCGQTSPSGALGGVFGLTIGPDGRHLYAAARSIGTIGHYTIDAAGNLAVAGCTGQLGGCTPTSPPDALASVSEVALALNAADLYSANEPGMDGMVGHLTLDAEGSPIFASCIGSFAGCATTNPGKALARTLAVAVSPDGKNVYAGGENGIAQLMIEPPSPAAPPPPPPPPGGDGTTPAFGSSTLVTLALAAARIPATGPLKVRIRNANAFVVTGRIGGRTIDRIAVARLRRVSLRAKAFSVGANARKTVRLRLPAPMRRALRRTGRLRLRLRATVKDPAGNSRTVTKRVVPRLRRAATG